MIICEESKQLKQLNEMFVDVSSALPTNIENSVYYPKIKHLLYSEIISFCKEKTELKQDLNILRDLVGEQMKEEDIRQYLDSLKIKYNTNVNNVGIDYHIERTRVDFGVPVFVVIKRDFIYLKKFVFRFKNLDGSIGIGDLSQNGILKNNIANAITGKEDN